MGFDSGFDIHPHLEETPENNETYRQFLDEVTQKYQGVTDPDTGTDDGKVLILPTDPDRPGDLSPKFVYIMMGEVPKLPSDPDRCDCFLRFSSKISGRLTIPAEPYIRSVRAIAEKYFGSRVRFWHELHETGDERQWGCYSWGEVREAERKVRDK